jgi:hypothetical protein
VNTLGEDMLFVQRRGAPTAELYHSDISQDAILVNGGIAKDTVLSQDEKFFLFECWAKSARLRTA